MAIDPNQINLPFLEQDIGTNPAVGPTVFNPQQFAIGLVGSPGNLGKFTFENAPPGLRIEDIVDQVSDEVGDEGEDDDNGVKAAAAVAAELYKSDGAQAEADYQRALSENVARAWGERVRGYKYDSPESTSLIDIVSNVVKKVTGGLSIEIPLNDGDNSNPTTTASDGIIKDWNESGEAWKYGPSQAMYGTSPYDPYDPRVGENISGTPPYGAGDVKDQSMLTPSMGDTTPNRPSSQGLFSGPGMNGSSQDAASVAAHSEGGDVISGDDSRQSRIDSLYSKISESEGGINSSNRGTANNKIVGSTHNTIRGGKPLSEMTVGEIMEY